MKLLIIFLGFVFAYTAADPQIIPVPGGLKGNGFCTTYWDCCKPSCSWAGNLPAGHSSPVASCAKNGDTVLDANSQSGCNPDGRGVAYMCSNQQPWAVSSTLSLGFAGGSFTGGADYSKCCSCFLISFPNTNKRLILQVTNTGGDAGVNQFDIAVPGGGVGINNGCAPQWNAPPDGWGQRYGGVQTIEECNQLPSQLQRGCRWKFEYLGGLNIYSNATTFQEVVCPQEITSISHCY